MRHYPAIILLAILTATSGCVSTAAVTGGPDLEIQASELLIHPTPLLVGQSVILEAKVRNSGTAPAGEFKIGFYADGHLIGDPLTAVNLDPNEFILAQGAWIPDSARQVRLEARADILDQITERREYNNIRLIYLTVGAGVPAAPAETAVVPVPDKPEVVPVAAETAAVVAPPPPPPPQPVNPPPPLNPPPPQVEYITTRDTTPPPPVELPDLAITLPDLSYSQAPQVGKEMTFSLQVHNLGAGNLAKPAPLLILINGTAIPSRAQVNYVAPGDMVMVHLPWTPAAEGWVEIKVVIDPDGEVAESSKNNNLVKRSLYVRP